MPTCNASKEIICAFSSLSGVMLMHPEVHQVYSDRPDLRFKQAHMEAPHMHRLTESGKSYSIAIAWECWKQQGWDEHRAWNSQAGWKYLKSVLPSLESSANPCPRQWRSYLSSRHTHLESLRLVVLTIAVVIACSSSVISQGNHFTWLCLQPLKLQPLFLSLSSPS